MKSWFAIVLVALIGGFASPSFALASPELAPQDEQRIQSLIRTVEQTAGAVFIRNGTTYDAKVAARFLRLKWQANSSKVHSAEELIREIGTRSGTSSDESRVKITCDSDNT